MTQWIRNVGIDLGIESLHEVNVVDPNGNSRRFKCGHSHAEIEAAIDRLEEDLPPGGTLRFIMEPTDTAWIPVAWCATRHGYRAYLAPAEVSHKLRQSLSRNVKSDRIDAGTLASIPAIPLLSRRLNEVIFATQEMDCLKRLAKRDHQLAIAIADRTKRVESLVRLALPAGVQGVNLTSQVGQYLCSYRLNPQCVLGMEIRELAAELAPFAGEKAEEAAKAWQQACQEAFAHYGEHGPIHYPSLQKQCRSELRLLRTEEDELAEVRKDAQIWYRKLDEERILQSVPGVGPISAVAALAALGPDGRYASAKKFKAASGYTPRVSESGVVNSKGKRMTKAGPDWLKRPLFMAADAARKIDPQMAKCYRDQMVLYGHHHTHALCVVAARLLERIYICHRDQRPYELRDLEGNPISPADARVYIAEHLQVSEEVRKRLRRVTPKKKRKAQPRKERAN